MADDKRDRDDQAHREAERQRERGQEEARTRADEPEPIRDDPDERLGDLDEALETLEYPLTTQELVDNYGDYEVETQDGTTALDDVFAATEYRTFESADDVRSRILGLIHR